MVRRLLLCAALWLATSAPVSAPHATTWGVLGPIEVRYVRGFPHYGMWEAGPRRITIRAGMHPLATRQTLKHEVCHAVLWDMGVVIGDEDTEDRVCDAWSTSEILREQGR